MKSYLIFCILFLLSGCAGIYYASPETSEIKCTSDCNFAVVGQSNGARKLNSWAVTKENIATKIRRPDRILKNDQIESWVYEERRWLGVMPIFLIPIPLMLPVGKDSITFNFKDDQFLEEIKSTHISHGYFCGIILGNPNTGKLCGPEEQYSEIKLEAKTK